MRLKFIQPHEVNGIHFEKGAVRDLSRTDGLRLVGALVAVPDEPRPAELEAFMRAQGIADLAMARTAYICRQLDGLTKD